MTADKIDDFPSVDGLHQGEDPSLVVIPVDVRNTIRAEVMPSFVSVMNNVIVDIGSDPQKLLNEDVSRKRVTIIVANDSVMISAKEDHANMGVGALVTPIGAPVVLETVSEIWVFPIDTATDPATVSFIVEQWAR